MQDEFVVYQGRQVPKEGFRVYVFGHEGTTKLVNSYEEYEASLESGWHSTADKGLVKKMVQVDLAPLTDLGIKKGHKNRRG